MPMRMTGIMSGMDTESIIQQLVAARQTKVDNAKKAQTKLQWKQDKWKELNTKLLNLYNKTTGNMRFVQEFYKKTTTASNSNAVSIITGETAVNGVQNMKIDSLAKTAYLTGAQLDSTTTSSTKLSDLGITEQSTFDVVTGTGADATTTPITLNGDSTIASVVEQLKNAGLNASFDDKNHRFFVSAKESGAAHNFEITNATGSAKVLSSLGLDTTAQATNAAGVIGDATNKASKIAGENAQVTLNGATFTSETNVFEINGLTFTCLAETSETFTVTTQDDTDGIYDMVKNFIKEYNSIINELDKLYNADSAKGYEPLTDDEKDAMSESEIEKWETKIKDSILRRDETVNSIASSLKEIMMSGVDVGGERLYLSDFGIETLGYFNAAENERNAYHIDGDEDDSNTSSKANTLKAKIASDPDTVAEFFAGLSQKLYEKMGELSKSIDGYSSFNSFYADKKMKEDYNEYTTKIADLEEKLKDYEDNWYSKFAAMETAMAQMQQNASAVTGLLGG